MSEDVYVPARRSNGEVYAFNISEAIRQSLINGDKQLTSSESDDARLRRRNAELEFAQRATQEAISAGMRAGAVKYIVSDAAAVFELRDNQLVPRDPRATDPRDPCTPLSFRTWLEAQRKEVPFLYTAG